MSLERLRKLIVPPAIPVEADGDWDLVERRLGVILPIDFKDWIRTYGTGRIDDFLWVLNPFSSNEYLNLSKQYAVRLEALRELRDQFGEELPYPLHPEQDGLIPCALTDNGDVVYWLSSGSPDEWTIVINESRGEMWESFSVNLTLFLEQLVTRAIRTRCFPEAFPATKSTFSQAE